LEYFKSSLLCPKNGFQAKDDRGSGPADERAHMGSLIGNLPPHPSSDNYSDTGGSAPLNIIFSNIQFIETAAFWYNI